MLERLLSEFYNLCIITGVYSTVMLGLLSFADYGHGFNFLDMDKGLDDDDL